jgi:hypothetical protein
MGNVMIIVKWMASIIPPVQSASNFFVIVNKEMLVTETELWRWKYTQVCLLWPSLFYPDGHNFVSLC